MNHQGENNPNAKLTQAQADEIRQRRASGERVQAIADLYGVSRQTVNAICQGRLWPPDELSALAARILSREAKRGTKRAPRLYRDVYGSLATAVAKLPETRVGTCANCVNVTTLAKSSDGYWECFKCTGEPAQVKHGPERSYESSGGMPTAAEVNRGMRVVMGDARVERDNRDLKHPVCLPPNDPFDNARKHSAIAIRDRRRGTEPFRKLGGQR